MLVTFLSTPGTKKKGCHLTLDIMIKDLQYNDKIKSLIQWTARLRAQIQLANLEFGFLPRLHSELFL